VHGVHIVYCDRGLLLKEKESNKATETEQLPEVENDFNFVY
jgi:hypothetical protein